MNKIKRIYSENLMLLALIVKAITGVLGTSLILSEKHPYVALIVLAIGAGINEYLLFFERSKNKLVDKKAEDKMDAMEEEINAN